MNILVRRAQWRAARTRARAQARADGRCIACLRVAVPKDRTTCVACGERANAARVRRRQRLASSAVERARAFGIDLTLLVSNLRLSPEERIAKAANNLQTVEMLNQMRSARQQ